MKLALAGAALGALLGSFTSAILLLDVATLDQFRFWVVGSLAGRGTDVDRRRCCRSSCGLGRSRCGSARSLNALALGDDMARSLGQRVRLARPSSARRRRHPVRRRRRRRRADRLRRAHRSRTSPGPSAAPTTGGSSRGRWSSAPILLLGADIIGRVVARPGELQVGIVTALIGAPFFIALVRRRKLAEL